MTPFKILKLAVLLLALPQISFTQWDRAWRSIGPTNIAGRFDAIDVHPTNPSIAYAAAIGGGLWKTTDGGLRWNLLTDDSTLINVSAVRVFPKNANILFLGTGVYGDWRSVKVPGTAQGLLYRSSDAGQSWVELGLKGMGWISKIELDENDANTIYVSAGVTSLPIFPDKPRTFLLKTTDGGLSWDTLFTGPLPSANADYPIDFSIDLSDPLKILVASGDTIGISKSSDGGKTWTAKTLGTRLVVGRKAIAFARSDPRVVYTLVPTTAGASNVYKSTDGGENWAPTGSGSSIFTDYFRIALAVSPTDPDRVLIGGIFVGLSIDGGATWQDIGGVLHVDQATFMFSRSDSRVVYNANDGGVYKSTDAGATWQDINEGLVTTIIYNLGVSPNANFLVCAPADWGGIVYRGNTRWSNFGGPEFSRYFISPVDTNIIFITGPFNTFARTTDGGKSWGGSAPGGAVALTPIIFHPTSANVVYSLTGKFYNPPVQLYQSQDTGGTWRALTGDLGRAFDVAVAPSNASYIYVLLDGKISTSADGGGTWQERQVPSGPTSGLTIAVSPRNPTKIYVHQGYGSILKSSDAGLTWISISSGLGPGGGASSYSPNYKVVVDPLLENTLYASNGTYVYFSTNDGANWQRLGRGLPNVVIGDIGIAANRLLYVCTQGRGVFFYPLSGSTVNVSTTRDVSLTFRLFQNYPNPFNPTTTVRYEVPVSSEVALEVYDILGRRVRTLVNRKITAGIYEQTLDASNLASGVYFIQLRAGSFTQVRTAVLLK